MDWFVKLFTVLTFLQRLYLRAPGALRFLVLFGLHTLSTKKTQETLTKPVVLPCYIMALLCYIMALWYAAGIRKN